MKSSQPHTAKMAACVAVIFATTLLASVAVGAATNSSTSPRISAVVTGLSEADQHLRMGITLMRQQKWTEAIGEFDAAIRIAPSLVAAHYHRGCCEFARGAIDRAIEDFNEVVRREPNHDLAYLSRGTCYRIKKRFQASLKDLDTSIALNRTNAFAFNSRASTYNALKQFDNAVADCTTSISLVTNDAKVFVVRGFAYMKMGNYRNALDDFGTAIQLDQAGAEAYNQVAWLKATSPDHAFRNGREAVTFATKACELTGWKSAQNLDTLAAACAETGDFRAAIDYQQQAIRLAGTQEELLGMNERLAGYEKGRAFRDNGEGVAH